MYHATILPGSPVGESRQQHLCGIKTPTQRMSWHGTAPPMPSRVAPGDALWASWPGSETGSDTPHDGGLPLPAGRAVPGDAGLPVPKMAPLRVDDVVQTPHGLGCGCIAGRRSPNGPAGAVFGRQDATSPDRARAGGAGLVRADAGRSAAPDSCLFPEPERRRVDEHLLPSAVRVDGGDASGPRGGDDDSRPA